MLDNTRPQNAQAESGAEQLHTLPRLRFYGDQFIFDTQSGMFFRLSPTAGFLLRAIDGGATVEELPGILQQQYGISRKRAIRDAELFLNDLAGLGVIKDIHGKNPNGQDQ